jgi:hypothetical protein
MALFKRQNPMEKLEAELASLRARAETLSNRHTTADAAFFDAKMKVERHLLEADLDADEKAGAKLEAAVAAWAQKRANLADALAKVRDLIAETEQKITAERDAAERASAADKLTVQIAAIEAVLPKLLQQSRAFADALSAIGRLHYESGQMESFVRNVTAQVEIAAGFSLAELKAMTAAIREGRQAIPREEPEPNPLPVPEPVAPTMTVFMMRSANYRDENRRKRFAGQYEDAVMPVPTAQRALRHGVAVSVADPRRAQLRGARGGDFSPLAPDVVDLDAVEEPKGVPYIGPDPALAEAHFTEIDRSGEARTIQIAVPRV